jgi:uncharacterized repeat protein (TIGR01451 family)
MTAIRNTDYTRNMHASVFYCACCSLMLTSSLLLGVNTQADSDSIAIKAVAEVEQPRPDHGRDSTKLVPADRVVSGDTIFYTLEIRNTAEVSVPRPTVTYPVPEHTIYTPDSAIGPGAEVTYSVDAGRSFDTPENLRIQEPGGQVRAATAADYTHIRWQLKNALKGNSVAFVRFRARLK